MRLHEKRLSTELVYHQKATSTALMMLLEEPQLCIHIASVRACVLSCFSRVRLFATAWTIARQAPLSIGFSRQEHWSALPRPPPGNLPDPWIEPAPVKTPALAGRFFTTGITWEAPGFSAAI